MDSKITPRKYYLDWLRVLAVMTVFILHCGRPFDTDDWHIKNAVTYAGMMAWATLLALWIMPLIFLISGSSLFYSVGRGRPGRFVKDKVMRLLVPLVVGVFTYSILGVYLDRLSHGTFQGSFFAFLPHYFDGLFPYGNFAWMGLHLWYLEWLFVYTIVLFPLFLWLKKGGGQRLLAGLGAFLARPGAVFLLALPGIVLGLILNPSSLLLGNRGWGGWPLPLYVFYFLAGFVVEAHEGLQERVRRQRWLAVAAAVAVMIFLIPLALPEGDPVFGSGAYAVYWSLVSLGSWCWVLAILGFGMQRLNYGTPFLYRANEAVLPFYILHQPVILCVDYFVLRWPIPDALKFFVIVATSFGITVGVYEYLVRRHNILRVLFGMKPLSELPTLPMQTTIGDGDNTLARPSF